MSWRTVPGEGGKVSGVYNRSQSHRSRDIRTTEMTDACQPSVIIGRKISTVEEGAGSSAATTSSGTSARTAAARGNVMSVIMPESFLFIKRGVFVVMSFFSSP